MNIRKYHTNQEVDWRAVMEGQRWVLMMRLEQYLTAGSLTWISGVALNTEKRVLENNLKVYQNLRKFLGYSNPAKIEKEIEKVLRDPAKKREKR